MGNLVLLFSGKLSSGLSVFRKVENGVIAKALFSTGFFRNLSRASGFRLQNLSIRKNRNNGAGKVGHPAFTAALFHHSQDTTILFGIGSIHPQKAGRINSGTEGKGFNGQTGIIRHHQVIFLQNPLCLRKVI